MGVFRIALPKVLEGVGQPLRVLGFGVEDDGQQSPLELGQVFGEAVLGGEVRQVLLDLLAVEPGRCTATS